MSMKSQQSNMRRLAGLLGQNLGYISGSCECGPNGAKQTFLHVGKVFLRALAKDLRLRGYRYPMPFALLQGTSRSASR